MNLIRFALRKPISILTALFAVVFFAGLSLRNMAIDIFPTLGTPTLYVAQTYGGLSPQQIEGFVSSYYEYHFLYITGIKSVESKSIQGLALLKLQFHAGTNMAQAMAEVVAQVNRARSFMPPGTLPPFVLRFDAGTVPVGQLVFSSPNHTLAEIQDLALFKVRPMFAALPGVSAPPPFGGNQRSVLIRANPDRLRSYQLSPEALITALAKSNLISPAGTVRLGDQALISPQNSVVDNIQELAQVPLKLGNGTSIYLRDVATVENGADITTGYALINGKRSVYIPVTKRSDASTWSVVQSIKQSLPEMQAAIPADIHVSYEFDQSGYVINSLKNLLSEGLLGAVLTGLMVLLFLGSFRSALIVVLTIPLALLAAVIGLSLTGQTINIMTLGGLALAVGILVDEATVTIENIHRHLEQGKPKARAIVDACQEMALPKLLILLSILAVFVPAVFMSGIPRAMFMPLSLAVGLAMIASFLLSQTLMPILANWWLKPLHVSAPASWQETPAESFSTEAEPMPAEPPIPELVPNAPEAGAETYFTRLQRGYQRLLEMLLLRKALLVLMYLVLIGPALALVYLNCGREIFPKINAGQLQVRLRLAAGTRLERTEVQTKKFLGLVESLVGKDQIAITSSFVGLQPPTYAINPIYLWTSGPHEAVVKINLKPETPIRLAGLKEQIRQAVQAQLPGMSVSFEPADLIEQIMSLGANTPIEIAVQGKTLQQGREFAEQIRQKLEGLPFVRDLQYALPLDYPSLAIQYDRVRAGQLGLTVEDISKSVVTGTSSSRFIQPNYWLDTQTGNSYQVQVEVPPFLLKSPEDIDLLPIGTKNHPNLYLRDVADWKTTKMVGEYDRLNQKRFISLSANLHGQDLGHALEAIKQAVHQLGKPPQGIKITYRGQAELYQQTLSELQTGLLLAVTVIFFLIAANFQSFRLALAVLAGIPAVLVGSCSLLILTGHTLNIQSFMGCIMAIGVAVANAILFITRAEQQRQAGDVGVMAALTGASERLRPILMTSLAMVAGMLPMASGLGEGGEQAAPLGTAVIGGLLLSVVMTLLILPALYAVFAGRHPFASPSLDPDDQTSQNFGQ